MPKLIFGKTFIMPMVITSLGVMTVASAQTAGSPFATKTKKKAWEIEMEAARAAQYPQNQAQSQKHPQKAAKQKIKKKERKAQSSTQPSYSQQRSAQQPNVTRVGTAAPQNAPSAYNTSSTYNAPSIGQSRANSFIDDYEDYNTKNLDGSYNKTFNHNYPSSASSAPVSTSGTAYYPGRNARHSAPPQERPYQERPYQDNNYNNTAHNLGTPPPRYPAADAPYIQPQSPSGDYSDSDGSKSKKAAWDISRGWGGIQTSLRGFFKIGTSATRTKDAAGASGWRSDTISSANIETEVSGITQGGLEYGIYLQANAEYDKYRRGFGGRIGDCPAAVAGCASDGAATPTAIRGHTSQFYVDGPSNNGW